MESVDEFILTLSCPDAVGVVAAVANFLAERNYNITNSAQYHDPQTGLFFMRVEFAAPCANALASPEVAPATSVKTASEPQLQHTIEAAFTAVATRFTMSWRLYSKTVKPRVLIMVSRFGHCLNDLLYRYRINDLPMDIRAIVSNHRDFYQLAASHNIPFHHLAVDPTNKPRQEQRLLEIIADEEVELVILARYMQVLSPELCEQLTGRAINIHHSFLPSFKGARPYHKAHARGVKLIGATAHFVTADLDEGPIIEQEAAAVNHAMTVEDFIAVGRDIESVVLARAVRYYIERRVLIDGNKTVVFR